MQITDFNDKLLFCAPMRIPKEQTRYLYKKYIPLKRKIDTVDITFLYYSGQRGDAQFTFEGPFTLGQTIELSGEPNAMLTILKENPFPKEKTDVQFELTMAMTHGFNQEIFVLDKSGNRYHANRRDAQSVSGKNNFLKSVLVLRGTSLNSIAYITVGEKPKEIIYKNVPLYFSK